MAHPPALLRHGGVEWRYLRGGSDAAGGAGRTTVLMLGGALGIAEFGFPLIEAIEREFRVIAPDYPPLARAAAVTDGLVRILDAEQLGRVAVHGASFGGLLAQALARRAPGRVGALVLSHTSAPQGQGAAAAMSVRMLGMLPARGIRALLDRRLGRMLDAADPFHHEAFRAALARLTKRDLMARMRLAEDLQASRFAAADLDGFSGRTLIVESDDDPMIAEAARSALRDLHPGAEVHRFHGTGHLSTILRPEEYNERVIRFLREEP
ncbi:MAG TPA: alpha/beta fold hydrolase [Dongiaceae bacterium]|nr:alpha/beta fold hydrolase [Dongiaceae bacterium]